MYSQKISVLEEGSARASEEDKQRKDQRNDRTEKREDGGEPHVGSLEECSSSVRGRKLSELRIISRGKNDVAQ